MEENRAKKGGVGGGVQSHAISQGQDCVNVCVTERERGVLWCCDYWLPSTDRWIVLCCLCIASVFSCCIAVVFACVGGGGVVSMSGLFANLES